MATICNAVLQLRPEFGRRLDILRHFDKFIQEPNKYCQNLDNNTNQPTYFHTIPAGIFDTILSFLPDLRQTQIANNKLAIDNYEQFFYDVGIDNTNPDSKTISLRKIERIKQCVLPPNLANQHALIKIIGDNIRMFVQYPDELEYYHDRLRWYNMEVHIDNENELEITSWEIMKNQGHRILHILPCGLLCVLFTDYKCQQEQPTPNDRNRVYLVDPETKKFMDITGDYIDMSAQLKHKYGDIGLLLDDFGNFLATNKNAINLSAHSPTFLKVYLV